MTMAAAAKTKSAPSPFCGAPHRYEGGRRICRLDKGHAGDHSPIRPSERAMAAAVSRDATRAVNELRARAAEDTAIGTVRGTAEGDEQPARPARPLPRVHRVKSWPEQFRAVVTGRKRFEMRRDDRNYQPGDTIELLEFRPELNQLQLVKSDGVPGSLTGRSWMGVIGYVSRGGPLPAGWCAFDLISVEDVNRLEGVRR